MQRKLKELYRPADNAAQQRATATRMEGMGLGGNLSKPTQEAYTKSINQTKVAMDKFIADQAKGLEYSAKLIKKQEDGMKHLRTAQQSMNKDSKEYLEIQEKIQRAEASVARQREQLSGRNVALNQGLDARQDLDNMAPKSRMQRLMGSPLMGGGLRAGAVAGGIAGLATTAERFSGYNQRLQEARGSAIQGTVGQDLTRVFGGKGGFESAFMPERQAAEGISKKKEDWNRITDYVKGIAGVAMIGAGAGLSTTGIGAMAGVPMMAGGAAMLTNDRSRLALTGGGKEYEQILSSERAKNFRENLENLKNQDPLKIATIDSYEQNYRQQLDTQRMLGLSDQSFRGGGGFQARGHQAGFMSDQMAGMAGGIVGAGGSTGMGGQAQFGLQMQRAGLTNASGILGSLSNSIGSTESTKRATISIMAEAFKEGMDNTDFAEENRRFTQSVAQAIGKSGATSVEDQDRISRMFGQFMGERTNRGVEAAGSAYEAFQARGSQTTGRRGAIRMAEAVNDPNLGKLDTQEINELLSARPDQLKSTNPMVQAYAKKAGLQPEALLDRLQGGRDKSRFLVPGRKEKADQYSKTINDYLQKSGMTYSEFAEKANAGGKDLTGPGGTEAMNSFGMLQGLISMENPQGMEEKEVTAQAGEEVNARNPNATPEQKARAQAELEKRDRMGDQMEAAGAVGEDAARKNLNAMTDDLEKAAKAASMFADTVVAQAQKIGAGSQANTAAQPQGTGFNKDLANRFNYTPDGNTSQPQGGVPKQ